MKKRSLLSLLLIFCLTLTSCASRLSITPNSSDRKLPDGDLNLSAPVGDADLITTDRVCMYFPSYDDISLTMVEDDVEFSPSRTHAESIVRAMLAFTGTGRSDSLGGDVRLNLYGSQPVTVSRNTVSIELGPSALRLSRGRLYLVGQAFANTLYQLDEIEYVNLLVSGKAVGVDISNTLPLGAFAYTEERDINALYRQKLSRKLDEDHTSNAFLANVALYYPLAGTEALVCDTQSISFSGQSTSEMVLQILSALSTGLEGEGVKSPPLPLLRDFVTAEPIVIESEEANGSILQLNFAQNLLEMLEVYHVDQQTSMASLCKTFCGFLPDLVGIRVYIHGSPIDQNQLSDRNSSRERGDLVLVKDMSTQVYNYARLYFADQNQNLTLSLRPMPSANCANPRKLLLELAKGPQTEDSVEGLQAIMPQDAISDPMMVGLSIQDQTLLVHFSPEFEKIGKTMDSSEERNFVYAMVNTLTASSSSIQSVGFFVSGEQIDGFTGDIYWKGIFSPLLALDADTDESLYSE